MTTLKLLPETYVKLIKNKKNLIKSSIVFVNFDINKQNVYKNSGFNLSQYLIASIDRPVRMIANVSVVNI